MWPQCQQGICSAGCGSPPGRAGPPFRCVFGAFFQCCRVRGREIVPRVDLPCSGTRCFPAYRINKPAAAAAGLPLPLPNAAFFPTPARLDIEPSLVLRRHSCLLCRRLVPPTPLSDPATGQRHTRSDGTGTVTRRPRCRSTGSYGPPGPPARPPVSAVSSPK